MGIDLADAEAAYWAAFERMRELNQALRETPRLPPMRRWRAAWDAWAQSCREYNMAVEDLAEAQRVAGVPITVGENRTL